MSGRAHYNHQTWENKRNVVRYVPAGQAEFVQEAIQGYALFKKLSEQYADEVIKQTRRERARTFPKPQNQSTPPKKKSKEMNRPK